jgi:hypothetical protein
MSVHRNIIPSYSQQDATFPEFICINFTDALHVSGGSSAHHQEHITTYSVRFCQPVLLLAATLEEMEFHLVGCNLELHYWNSVAETCIRHGRDKRYVWTVEIALNTGWIPCTYILFHSLTLPAVVIVLCIETRRFLTKIDFCLIQDSCGSPCIVSSHVRSRCLVLRLYCRTSFTFQVSVIW